MKLLTLAATLLLLGCTTGAGGGDLIGRDWSLTGIEGFDTMPSGVATPTIRFGADGRLGGNTGCNSAGAAYTVDGDRLAIEALITTKRACLDPRGNELEVAYVRAVEAARRYRIEGGELQLLSDAGTVVARISCQILHIASFVALGVVGGAKLADPAKSGDYRPFLTSLQHVSWWAVPALYFANLAFQAAAKAISPPWVWETVRAILDQLRLHAFRGVRGELQQHNRVTLFKHVWWRWSWCRWPWSGWLVPVERSGYTTRKTDTAFLAPDDGGRAQGIAGRAWASNETVSKSNLPAVTDKSPEDELKQYADETYISVELLRSRLVQKKSVALSLTAFPVEVKNKVWGVIVFDSRSKQPFPEEAIEHFRLVGACLGKVLGGARK
jgi:heat shock protein HslJ